MRLLALLFILSFSLICEAQSGFTSYGFYDNFSTELNEDSTGNNLFWHTQKAIDSTSLIHLSRTDTTGLDVSLNLEEGVYLPFGVSFGEDSLGNPRTMDFSGNTKVMLRLSNLSDTNNVKIKIGLVDTAGQIAEYYPEVDGGVEYWYYEIYSEIKPGESKEIIKDFTNVMGYNIRDWTPIYPDLTAIKSLIITCLNVNTNQSNGYAPLPLKDVKLNIFDIKVGDFDDPEKDKVVDYFQILDDSTNYKDSNSVSIPDTIPELLHPGTNGYGFYYTPGQLEIESDGFNSIDGSFGKIVEDTSKMTIIFRKESRNNDVITFGFGNDSTGKPKTINLKYAAEMEILMANRSFNKHIKAWFQLEDINGQTASYLKNVPSTVNYYQYESSFSLSPGKEALLKMDLTGLCNFNSISFNSDSIDLTKIQSFQINLLNANLDANDNYISLPVDSGIFELKYIKVGLLKLDSYETTFLNDEAIYSDLIEIWGCTNPQADNFSPLATKDNGSCYFSEIPAVVSGCIDSEALNFNEFVNTDNGSCIYEQSIVLDLPLHIKAEIDSADIIEAESDILSCEIDFTKIIDSISISQINASDSLIGYSLVEWNIFQRGNKIVLYSTILSSELESGKVLQQNVLCSIPNGRLLGIKEVTLLAEINDNDIILGKTTIISSTGKVIFYPNPVSDYLTLMSDGHIEIHTVDGQLIFEGSVQAGEKVYAGGWATGMYLISVTSKEENYTSTFFKH